MPRSLKLLAALAVVGALAYLIGQGYTQPWTGFGVYTNAKGEEVRSKTLWDWLALLVVPLFLASAAWWLDASRKRSDQRLETDRQRQKTLEDYFAVLTDILIKDQLHGTNPDRGRSIARTRTLAALRLLDGGRKAQLLQFLYESELLSAGSSLLDLNGADLDGAILDNATLEESQLRGVYFRRASMRRAHLAKADLRGSDFSGADLTEADLTGARLAQATFAGAKLGRADLTNADIDQADFRGADLTGARPRRSNSAPAKPRKDDFTDARKDQADLLDADTLDRG